MFDPKPLGDAVISHMGGGTPPRQIPSYWGGDIPWASVKDFSEDSEQMSSTQETITRKGLNASASNLIPAGTPLVCTRMAVGRAAMSSVPLAINQDVKALYPAPGVNPHYLLAVMQYAQRFAEAQSIGSTVKGIRIEDYLAIPVPQAPEAEQPKIAEVLATLNKAIHQTEAIVEKLKQVKQGLLHDLLTRGVDANGELRPSYETAPDLYQKTVLGWRPKDWEVCQVFSVLAGIDAGKSPDCQDVPAKGDQWGVLKVGAVHPDCLKKNENKVIEQASLKNPAYLVRNGDLLLSRANTFELVGLVCYVTNHPERLMLSDKTLRLSVKANRMTTPFLFWLLQHPKTRTQIEIAATGTSGSMKNISQGGVEQLWISRPQIDEQEEITKRLLAASDRHRDEQEKLSKMREMKSGLMADLLTGRVRVTPLLA